MFILVIDSDRQGRREFVIPTEVMARDAWESRVRKRDTYSATLWCGSRKLLDFDRGE
jgi:hypothetical protein